MRYLAKSDEFEGFLERLNGSLVREFADDEPTRCDLPTLQIVGLPRSGSTLIFQLLAKTGLLGYPSNVMAIFWRVPAVGARVQHHLRSSSEQVSLNSIGGRTPEPLDPHEFGYFWRNALGHERNDMRPARAPIDPASLQRTLDQVNSVFEAPTVYKNFLVPTHVDYFSQSLARQRYVLIRRPRLEVAASLLATRNRLGVSADSWLGPIPVDPKADYATPVHRVAHQVASLDRTLSLSGLENNVDACVLDYDDVCNDPRGSVARVCHHVGVQASDDTLCALPERLESHSSLPAISEQEHNQLLAFLQH